MRSLVTGATGFIGSHVTQALLDRGDEVRALVRTGADLRNLHDLQVETVVGDVRDAASLERAVRGCQRVFHVAALYSFWVPDPALLDAVNVVGTRNVFAAAERAGIETVVYTSSVAALGVPRRGEIVTEETPVDPARIVGAYKRSKYVAEQVAAEFARRGPRVVIVNPSFPVGPGDVKPTPTGRVVVDFLNGRMPAYVDTGMNVVSVRDVAVGHVLAAEEGRSGERYILGGENLALKEFLSRLSEVSGRSAPR
ncbi:MAG: NAD-dependent epimerase/dehydratase family protein, partial [Candidatus Bipolaricaulota bacterium]|nr:NAD-dependent epimerase/dehydratase family protein [Candidatus Bipolaricaulota bacterium]